jgi:hypothetical protein
VAVLLLFGSRASASLHVEGTLHASAAAVEQVRVDHGRADVLVTEQFLDGANIVSSLKQVGGEGMPLMPSSA